MIDDSYGECYCDVCGAVLDLDAMKEGNSNDLYIGKSADHFNARHICAECRMEGLPTLKKWKISWENTEGEKENAFAWFPKGTHPDDHMRALTNLAELNASEALYKVEYEVVEE